MYEARYWGGGGIVSAYTILHVQAGFIQYVAVPRQDSIRPVKAYTQSHIYAGLTSCWSTSYTVL